MIHILFIVHTCEHLDEVKTEKFYEYKKSDQGKCPKVVIKTIVYFKETWQN